MGTFNGDNNNNVLYGGSDADTLNGGAGDDFLNGGSGADNMSGGSGNDRYIVDSTSDRVTENSGEGTDTIRSSVTYTTSSDVENLILTGSNDIDATGNELGN